MRVLLAVVGLAILCPTLSQTPGQNLPPRADRPMFVDIVEGQNEFAFRLFKTLRRGRADEGNSVISPFGLSTSLAMTYAGAEGGTKKEMAEVLNFPADPEQFHPAYGGLIRDLAGRRDREGFDLAIANRLWTQAGIRLLPPFVESLKANYNSEVGFVDLEGRPEEARQIINRWTEQKTGGYVKDLLPPGAAGSGGRVVLTNAIYFKGAWDKPFPPQETRPAPFTRLGGRVVEVPMMEQVGDFRYATLPDIQVLEMTYAKERLSFLVVLPKAIDGLARVEDGLSVEALEEWDSKLRRRQVLVRVPRFGAVSRFRLAPTLREMGLKLPFGPEADFSGMTGSRDISLSDVVHQAVLEVDEKGSEGAAGSATIQKRVLPPIFKANHPFLFLIRDNRSGTILFLGRVTDPSAKVDSGR